MPSASLLRSGPSAKVASWGPMHALGSDGRGLVSPDSPGLLETLGQSPTAQSPFFDQKVRSGSN